MPRPPITDIVTHRCILRATPEVDEVPGGDALADTESHEIDRLFYGHCRMERPWCANACAPRAQWLRSTGPVTRIATSLTRRPESAIIQVYV